MTIQLSDRITPLIVDVAKGFRPQKFAANGTIDPEDSARLTEALLTGIRGKGFLMGERYLDPIEWHRAIRDAWPYFHDPFEFAEILADRLKDGRLILAI